MTTGTDTLDKSTPAPKDFSHIEMNPNLKLILEVAKSGRNLTIIGPGGSGKSTLIDFLVNHPDYMVDGTTILCGSTGVSAVNITEKTNKPASTLHRAMGFGIQPIRPGDVQIHDDMMTFFQKEVTRIIVDETSMIRVDLVEKFLNTLRTYVGLMYIRGQQDIDKLPQIIFLGDQLQIEAVSTDKSELEELRDLYGSHFFFDSLMYKSLQFVELSLFKNYRTSNLEYLDTMFKFRDGSITQQELNEFNRKYVIKSEEAYWDEVLPTPDHDYVTICSTNAQVNSINDYWLNLIDSPSITFEGVTRGDVKPKEKVVLDTLVLKQGATVMIRKNGDGYVNGTVGKIVSLPSGSFFKGDDENIYIGVESEGRTFRISPAKWDTYNANGDIVGTYYQIPISVCYALSVHKSQGNQFDYMLIDKGRSFFASGMCYTALSRSSNPDGMRILDPRGVGLKMSDVKTDSTALNWTQRVEKKTLDILKELDTIDEVKELRRR